MSTLTRIHSNEVKISGAMIDDISYVDGSCSVSAGQPFELPPLISRNGSDWTIKLNCGRHNSIAIATGFTGLCGGSDHMCATADSRQPSELNFYFGLRVSLAGSDPWGSVAIYLGQGSAGVRNNWWLGSPSLVSVPGQMPFIPLVDERRTFKQILLVSLDGVSKFNLADGW